MSHDLHGSARIDQETGRYPCFDVDGISAGRLLLDWRWLVVGGFSLLAVNAFGDLFLADDSGSVHWLDVTGGKISVIADSEAEFRKAEEKISNKKMWFRTDEADQARQRGYSPDKGQCVGSKIPWILGESAGVGENLYVAELYEYVSFMGALHRQLKDVPDGGKIRIKIQRPAEQPRDAKD